MDMEIEMEKERKMEKHGKPQETRAVVKIKK